MNLLNGKKIAQEIQNSIREHLSCSQGRKPGLAFLLVGEHPASLTYLRAKQKACSATGIQSTLIKLPSTLSHKELLHNIEQMNQDPSIDGILVQLPLPSHLNTSEVLRAIDPTKDVDGFHPLNFGKMLLGEEGGFFPCTPFGIHRLLKAYQIPIQGKRVVIVGRSNLVGKPLAAILMQKKPDCNATVTLAHRQSEHLQDICLSADILVVAIGHPHLIQSHMVRSGAIVVDVGINRQSDGTLVG